MPQPEQAQGNGAAARVVAQSWMAQDDLPEAGGAVEAALLGARTPGVVRQSLTSWVT